MTHRRLKATMTYHDITIRDLAEVVELSPSCLCDKINGKRRWWLDEVVAIANYFTSLECGLSLEELFELKLTACV